MAGKASQIVVKIKEAQLDEVVLDRHAEKLQGGLPPRRCIWLVITNGEQCSAVLSPFSSSCLHLRKLTTDPSAHIGCS